VNRGEAGRDGQREGQRERREDGREAGTRRVPRLHLITDGAILTRDGFLAEALEVAEALVVGIPTAFHLRGPGLSGRDLWEVGRRLVAPLQARGLRFLVNDRADVAQALGADGVHLAERSLPAFPVREWMGTGALLGRSVHDPDDAGREGAVAPGPAGRRERASLDYLMVGTLWSTASHPGRPGTGVPRLLRVRSVIQEAGADFLLPLIGIGGVTPERVAEVLEGGGDGVAVKGGIWEAPDPAAAAVRFQERLRDGRVEGARMTDEPGGDG
jgi:thiamine-phosphate diphosphorylase